MRVLYRLWHQFGSLTNSEALAACVFGATAASVAADRLGHYSPWWALIGGAAAMMLLGMFKARKD